MKYKKILPAALVAVSVVLAGYLFLVVFNDGEQLQFRRLTFQALEKSAQLRFDASRHTWGMKGKKLPFISSIPSGTGILFEDRGKLLLEPGVNGEKGILFRIHARSKARNKEISLGIRLERGGQVLYEKTAAGDSRGRIAYFFSLDSFEFQEQDRLLIDVRGQGALVVSRPVIYDRVEKERREYIFVIALDTMRGDKLGRRVKGEDLTPNLDRFAKEALVFVNAFAQGSWTLPSFSSFFTGLYEFNHQVTPGTVLGPQKPFLVENLARRFVTAGIHGGTWLDGKIGNSRGFDVYRLGSRTKDPYAARSMFENARTFIEENPVPRLFMFLHTYAVHAPYNPPGEFLDKLNSASPAKTQDNFSRKNQYAKDVSPKTRAVMEELYEAEILAFDFYFGEFVETLKAQGIYHRSTIVFLSDHGEEFYEHRGWSHGHSLYNELIKVPLLIKFPGDKYGGRIIREPVGVFDTLPTLLDFFNLDGTSSLDGISLIPLIEKGNDTPRVLVSSMTGCSFFDPLPKRIAMMSGGQKLILNFEIGAEEKKAFFEAGLPPEPGKFEIFDLEQDPGETKNLFPRQTRLLKLLEKELKEIISKVRVFLKGIKGSRFEFDEEELENLKSMGYL